MFDRVPFYWQLVIFAGLAGLIVLVAWLVAPNLREMGRTADTLREELATKENDIRQGRMIEARQPELAREIANLEQKLADLEQILPTSRETGDLLKWIKAQSDEYNLDLKSFSPQGLRQVEFYKEFPIDMEIVARYHDLGYFLDRVSKYSRIINVDNLKISGVSAPQAAEKTIQATFTATTFVGEDERPAEATP